jgi:CDP-paratose 2-epimerase
VQGQRYLPLAHELRSRGICEARPLDFHSPYGCSKGTADQYVLDYARSYGLATTVFRMSCIYGPRQFGTEDQGWVAHFILRALRGEPITLYGDGMQVRDVLYVDDLVDAFLLAEEQGSGLAGRAFNMGGGPANAISLRDLLDQIEALHGERPPVSTDEWRTGDQRYYVSDTQAFQAATGWRPRVAAAQGIELLYRWLAQRQRRGASHLERHAEGAH